MIWNNRDVILDFFKVSGVCFAHKLHFAHKFHFAMSRAFLLSLNFMNRQNGWKKMDRSNV